jgi:hypothetical protein
LCFTLFAKRAAIFDATHGKHLANAVAYKRRTPSVVATPRVQEVGADTPNLLNQMEKERAKSEVKFRLDFRIPEGLVKWLLWFLMGGGALTAAEHWIK